MKHFWSSSSRFFSWADFLLISLSLTEHLVRKSEAKLRRQLRGYLSKHFLVKWHR